MKKIVLTITICVVLLAIACSLFIHFAPVSYDAGACGGGFDTWIFDKYKNELLQKYITEHNSDLRNIEIIDDSKVVNYEGRYISIQFDINEKDRQRTLYFVGKRVWIENYSWEICQVIYDGEVENLSDYIASTNTIKQTNFTVWILPLLIGVLIRLVFIKWKKGYILSGVFALITVVVWFWTKNLVSHGVDGTVMLFAWMSTILTGGSLIVGAISLLIKKIKLQEES